MDAITKSIETLHRLSYTSGITFINKKRYTLVTVCINKYAILSNCTTTNIHYLPTCSVCRNTDHHLFMKLSSLFIQQDQNIQPSSLFNILNFLSPYPVHSLTRQILWCITVHFISDVCFDINMPIRISSHRNHSAPTYKPIVDTLYPILSK